MHPEALHFTLWARHIIPHAFGPGVRALDAGGGDINGNNHHLFHATAAYFCNDVAKAPNVTHVCKTKDLPFENGSLDTVVSTECLEHDPEHAESMARMVQLLRPGGALVLTIASTGRAEHGTRRTSPESCWATIEGKPEFQDYYRNLTLDDIKAALGGDLDAHFSTWTSHYNANSYDVYFLGVKHDSSNASPPKFPPYKERSLLQFG